MKLNKLFVALMVVALPLGFTACGGDDNDDNGSYEFPEAPNKAKAATYTFSSQETPIQSVSFGEGNSAIIEMEGVDGVEYIIGTYTEKDGTYTVTSPDGQTYQFKVSVNGSSYDVQITVGQEQVTVTAKKTTATASGADLLLCDWKPFRTKINLTKVIENGRKVEKPGTLTKEWDGANFEVIKTWAEDQGCDIDEDLEGYVLQKVAFFGTYKFSAAFANKKSYAATWKTTSAWKDNGADLQFTWEDEKSKENDFIKDGKARVKIYTSGAYEGECWLTLISSIDDKDDKWNVEVNFRLIRF